MKVLYIYKALATGGGIERVLIDKMNYLVDRGFSVYMLTADQGKHVVPYQMDSRIIYEDLKISFHKQYSYHFFSRIIMKLYLNHIFKTRLRKHIEEINPDIVICVSEYYVDVILSIIKNNIPLIVENHSSFKYTRELKSNNLFYRIRRTKYMNTLHRATKIISLTNKDMQDWEKSYRNVMKIPNVVHLNDTEHFSNCENHKVIFVGRIAAQKGIYDLIEIWKRIYNKYPNWELNVYGEGELSNDFVNTLSQYENHLGITYNNFVSDIFEKYCESSILVVTSIQESFCLVIPEAMSCGLPVVAFDCDYGPSDIITDSYDGYLVKDRNIDVFVNRLSCLIEDKNLRIKLGKQAVKSAQRYRTDIVMPKWIDLFNSLH